MWLRSLTVNDLRCHRHAVLEFGPGSNAIVGDNGVGKTSLLEAAYLVSRTLSFRGSPPGELIRHNAPHALVIAQAQWRDRSRRIAVQRERHQAQVRIEGSDETTVHALARLLPIQVMDPRTHRVVEDGPVHRRRVVDWGVFHVEHRFLSAWAQFQRVLRQRNAACRNGNRSQLRAWSTPFIESALAVDRMRREHLQAVAGHWREAVAALLGEDHAPVLSYRPGWAADTELASALANAEERELQVGHTVIGPHRADVALRLDGRQVRHQASRGQQKALVLALLVAQSADVTRVTGESPVLLIDDFSAEWGAQLRRRAAALLDASGCQWISTWLDAPDADLPLSKVFHVEHRPEGPVIN